MRGECSAVGESEFSAMNSSQKIFGANQRPVNIGSSQDDNASAEYASGFSAGIPAQLKIIRKKEMLLKAKLMAAAVSRLYH